MARKSTTTIDDADTQEAASEAAPKLVWRGSRTWRHDLFKLELSKFKQNQSWQKYEPSLLDVEHVHFFHSTSKNGQPQEYASAVGNHFHKVTTSVAPDGSLVAECGPPLKHVDKKLKNGKSKRTIEAVQFLNGDDETLITDTHTHVVSYVGSEICSEETMKQQAQRDSDKLKKLEEARVAQQASA